MRSIQADVAGAALVTGASGGIGMAIARALSARGYPVALHANSNLAAAQALADELVAADGRAIAVRADLTCSTEIGAMIGHVTAEFGAIAVLVNNAGICNRIALGEMDEAMIDTELAVNVKSVVLVTQACLPHMGTGSAVVNISSNLGVKPAAGLTLYCATKAAVVSLTEGFARELGGRGIRVNGVGPGGTHTNMTADLDGQMISGIVAQTPLGRFGEPEDIANAVAFLAAPEASWITGRTLVVDGGWA